MGKEAWGGIPTKKCDKILGMERQTRCSDSIVIKSAWQRENLHFFVICIIINLIVYDLLYHHVLISDKIAK